MLGAGAYQDGAPRVAQVEGTQYLEARHVRQFGPEQQQVGAQYVRGIDAVAAGARLADHAQVLAAFTQLDEPGAHGRFVIHDQ